VSEIRSPRRVNRCPEWRDDDARPTPTRRRRGARRLILGTERRDVFFGISLSHASAQLGAAVGPLHIASPVRWAYLTPVRSYIHRRPYVSPRIVGHGQPRYPAIPSFPPCPILLLPPRLITLVRRLTLLADTLLLSWMDLLVLPPPFLTVHHTLCVPTRQCTAPAPLVPDEGPFPVWALRLRTGSCMSIGSGSERPHTDGNSRRKTSLARLSARRAWAIRVCLVRVIGLLGCRTHRRPAQFHDYVLAILITRGEALTATHGFSTHATEQHAEDEHGVIRFESSAWCVLPAESPRPSACSLCCAGPANGQPPEHRAAGMRTLRASPISPACAMSSLSAHVHNQAAYRARA
jgi:hypothetical protein